MFFSVSFIFFSRGHKIDKNSSWKGIYFRKEMFKLFKTQMKTLCLIERSGAQHLQNLKMEGKVAQFLKQ